MMMKLSAATTVNTADSVSPWIGNAETISPGPVERKDVMTTGQQRNNENVYGLKTHESSEGKNPIDGRQNQPI
jgi:hypothetical protein